MWLLTIWAWCETWNAECEVVLVLFSVFAEREMAVRSGSSEGFVTEIRRLRKMPRRVSVLFGVGFKVF